MIMSYVLGSPLTCTNPNHPPPFASPPFSAIPCTLFLIHSALSRDENPFFPNSFGPRQVCQV